MRYWVLPHIEDYRPALEARLSARLALPLTIGHVEAHWRGLRPWFALQDVRLSDVRGQPALTLPRIEASLAWRSLLVLEPRLHRLDIQAPDLAIRRDAQGRLHVAGIPVLLEDDQEDNRAMQWLLAQYRVVIREARLSWHDELRGAPPLALTHVNFDLHNHGRRHRFGFTAQPPAALAARLDVRGDFVGRDLKRLPEWRGQAYAAVDYADLAGWRPWLDYPLELPQGSGALRLWLSLANQELTDVTADIALHQVHLRLAPELPRLELQSLSGRLGGRWLKQGFELRAQRLSLLTEDAIQLPATDFQLAWQAAADEASDDRLQLSFSSLDLQTLERLGAHLPLPAGVRQRLQELAPRGRLQQLALDWQGRLDGQQSLAQQRYAIRGRFERLGLNAQGALPGFVGISGQVEGNEQRGVFNLDSQDAALELPAVFAEPRIELGQLQARLAWQRQSSADPTAHEIAVELSEARFENRDAAGAAQGRYVFVQGAEGPGVIDLSARLSRGEGPAVWRYIPLAVGQGVRDWLQSSIVGGISDETTLRLKGDLRHFPFVDGSGIFMVKGRFSGANLDYAHGWPVIERISGTLEFIGNGMRITADSAQLYGVKLNDVVAQIKDLSQEHTLLVVSGQAAGPTADFLRFIDTSPVAQQIDHFTSDMRAQGQGRLSLRLELPLSDLDHARIEGQYGFAGNQLKLDEDLPALENVSGQLRFTDSALSAQGLEARLLGMPLTVNLRSLGEGQVRAEVKGQLSVSELRRHFDRQGRSLALLDQLSGSTPWQGQVVARKNKAEVSVSSDLRGLSSSLPEPFNKSALETWPTRLERRSLAMGDELRVELGEALGLQLERRPAATAPGRLQVQRGTLRVGPGRISSPERGVLVALSMPVLDVDLWRELLAGLGDDPAQASAPARADDVGLPVTQLQLQTPSLNAFGHQLQDLELRARRDAGQLWRIDLKSRDAAGSLSWKAAEGGRLGARLKRLSLNPVTPSGGSDVMRYGETVDKPLRQLPGLDIDVEQFTLHDKALGHVKLSADNRAGVWDAQLEIDNPDGELDGKARWQPFQARPDMQLEFTLQARSLEKLLARLGYADAVKRGRATLSGSIGWQGTPLSIDYPSLSGALKVEASNGQFYTLEPGAGRLLGILSLQSLPRRISLDFRDVFSQGFAFDRIEGDMSVRRGVISTDNLQISGPAARVLMKGNASVPQETQDLRVRVQPAIGESLAVGAMIANPAAGAIAWLAQKALKDPIDQAFAFEYAVTGTWAEPRVEKLSAPRANGNAFGKNNE